MQQNRVLPGREFLIDRMRHPLPEDDLDLVLAQTRPFWQQYDGARVFVTGGTGFIGAWLLEAFQHAQRQLQSSAQLVVLSRDPDRARATAPHLFNDASILLIAGDVCNFTPPGGQFDLCIHAAADVGDRTRAADHAAVFDSSVTGTRKVLDLALTRGTKRFLLTSSGAIYGVQPPTMEKISETYVGAPDPLQVSAAYGNGKRAAEWLCSEAASRTELEVVSARIFALIGPGLPLDGTFAAGNFMRDVLARKPVSVEGNGQPVRSYLYAADACIWLLAMLQSGVSGQAYNLGSEASLSIAELAWEVVRANGASLDQPGIPTKASTGALVHAPRYVPDTSKARQTLGLQVHTPLDVALQKTLQWNRLAMNA